MTSTAASPAFGQTPALPAEAPARAAARAASAVPAATFPSGSGLPERLSVAVVLPCFNEEKSIASVIADFRAALPHARLYVFDNGSTDGTRAVAERAGAAVFGEPRRGKGNVVRRMFADVDADVYVMADGDGTYDASAAPMLVRTLIDERVDMVVGTRSGVTDDAGRAGHAFGNRLFNVLYGGMFGFDFSDIFSGYRVMSRRFVKSFPALSAGFEIETEMSVHASQLRIPTLEVSLPYGRRLEGAPSKLKTYRDGFRILRTFLFLLKETSPVTFYGALAGLTALVAIILAAPLVQTYLATGLVPRFPTAILATGLMIIAALLATCGLILDSLAFSRREQKRILYLSMPAVGADARGPEPK
ncbi:glycosyltransferase [Alsobacter sp. SYSU M60028]|uniref:Glycosyltransferase n=1 Tax=Alsobacter ponti TaxID=2962936 RepID=A0ABT1LE32_9HYPH|nr:glycosyltransferase [Alsobacter ponti]MCP8939765.1 glycosyltransferase [Alsobacter ponti]